MRPRTALLVAFAVGYYYGARAGRERYEQLDRILAGLRKSRPYLELRMALLETIDASRHRAAVAIREAARGDDTTEVLRLAVDDTLELPSNPAWN